MIRFWRDHRLLVLAIFAGCLLGSLVGQALARSLLEESCEVKWRASSIEIVDGKPSEPHETTNCDPR
jgi:hypothetical protein